MKSISPKAFEYLRSKRLFALPSRQHQERFLKDFQVKPGLLTESLDILAKKVETFSQPHEKFGVLCFDEMQIRKCFEFEPSEKQIFGPYKKMQAAIVRGLTSSWKQPVFADFDKTMTKDLLMHIIMAVENSGINVVAISFDMGNTKLIKELGLSPTVSSFRNPYDDRREIFCFPDAPHLLKLWRNHCLDQGKKTIIFI